MFRLYCLIVFSVSVGGFQVYGGVGGRFAGIPGAWQDSHGPKICREGAGVLTARVPT